MRDEDVLSPILSRVFSSGVETIRGLTARALCVCASLHTIENLPKTR